MDTVTILGSAQSRDKRLCKGLLCKKSFNIDDSFYFVIEFVFKDGLYYCGHQYVLDYYQYKFQNKIRIDFSKGYATKEEYCFLTIRQLYRKEFQGFPKRLRKRFKCLLEDLYFAAYGLCRKDDNCASLKPQHIPHRS